MMRNNLKVLMAKKQQEEGNSAATYRAISDATGISTSTLYKWTSGKIKSYDKNVAARLCAFFDVLPGDLFYLTD